jgi:type VI secretion system secreted protein Hcp
MRTKLMLGVVLVVLACAGAGTYAWAGASATETQTLNACVSNDGTLRLVAVAGACRRNEDPVSWNTVGPQGAQGAQGAQGVQGPQGVAGPAGSSAADPDGLTGTALITGQKSGALPAVQLTGSSHEIVSPRDPASGLPTGKRMHKPFTITKVLDKATPMLLSALVTNENLTKVKLTLQEGGKDVATVELTNANLADYQAHGTSETWSFTYQKITWTWLDGGITASDDWEAPVS